MIPDVKAHLHATPFVPFSIVTTSGQRYRIPSADHANVSPQGTRTVVWFDDDSSVTIAGLHIAAIEKDAAGKNGGGIL